MSFSNSYLLDNWTITNPLAGSVLPDPAGNTTPQSSIQLIGSNGSSSDVNGIYYYFTVTIPIGASGTTWSFHWVYSSSGGTGAGTTNNSAGHVKNGVKIGIVDGSSTIKSGNKSITVAPGDVIGFWILLQSNNTSMSRTFTISSFSAPDIPAAPSASPLLFLNT